MDTLNELNSKLEDIQKEMNKAIEEIKNGGFQKVFIEYFDNHPEIQAIAFVGYIPAFNDGEPCIFGTGEINFASPDADLNGEIPVWEVYEDEYPGWIERSPAAKKIWDGKNWVENPDYNEDAEAIAQFIASNEKVINQLFGDNFQVVITREGIHLYDYDCGW